MAVVGSKRTSDGRRISDGMFYKRCHVQERTWHFAVQLD